MANVDIFGYGEPADWGTSIDVADPIADAPVDTSQGTDTAGVDWYSWVSMVGDKTLEYQKAVKQGASGDATVSNRGGVLAKDGTRAARATGGTGNMMMIAAAVLVLILLVRS